MIDQKELRIGNWIADSGGKMWQIDCWERWDKVAAKPPTIGGFEVHPFTENVSSLSPIPITPEWLERVGFERRKDHYPFDDILKNTWFQKQFKTSYIDSPTAIDINGYSFTCWVSTGEDGGGALNKIYFVHQLQNLYFALTGEELTIRPETAQD